MEGEKMKKSGGSGRNQKGKQSLSKGVKSQKALLFRPTIEVEKILENKKNKTYFIEKSIIHYENSLLEIDEIIRH
jgi:hypothetical protein